MTDALALIIGEETFECVLEMRRAPALSAALVAMISLNGRLLQARWSGCACWVPLGRTPVKEPIDNLGHAPRPGQILPYAGPASETESLLSYVETRFSCASGKLLGGHAMTVRRGMRRFLTTCARIADEAARTIRIEPWTD